MIKNQAIDKRPLNILEKIEASLERLNDKMEVIIEIQKTGNDNQKSAPGLPDASLDVMTLLSMPDHLRKTAMAICRCGRATAEEISVQTSRARAVETGFPIHSSSSSASLRCRDMAGSHKRWITRSAWVGFVR